MKQFQYVIIDVVFYIFFICRGGIVIIHTLRITNFTGWKLYRIHRSTFGARNTTEFPVDPATEKIQYVNAPDLLRVQIVYLVYLLRYISWTLRLQKMWEEYTDYPILLSYSSARPKVQRLGRSWRCDGKCHGFLVNSDLDFSEIFVVLNQRY